MNASIVQGTEPVAPMAKPSRVQIVVSTDAREADFSALDCHPRGLHTLDPVSVADLLRNAFVYPPHSIYRDVKIAISGFDPSQDLHNQPKFHFAWQSSSASARPAANTTDEAVLLERYHSLLCNSVSRSSKLMQSPWMLQSGGKDSTSMAIAVADARPDTTCITYLGGTEEDEVDSARFVARQLGLRHESLVCDPGRAYDRYLAMVPRMPLLTADFAMLSYADLATEIATSGGDGILDAMGSDPYFGVPTHWRQRIIGLLARGLRLPRGVFESSLVVRNFKLCFALSTLQMNAFERFYPGSRFSDQEVDALLGRELAAQSRERLEVFRGDIAAANSMEARRRVAATVVESASFGKGMYAASALSLRLVYPYCDTALCNWIFNEVPNDQLIGPGGVNKVLVRKHIAQRFQHLPYVSAKGCFRFDLCGLARLRFDQVHAFAMQAHELLPGAQTWLETHRTRLDNKYFASKFYLLAIALPWLLSRMHSTDVSESLPVKSSAP